jgi:hypothetical protein
MFGRDGELTKLNQVRNDPTKPIDERRRANKALEKIVDQMRDRTLMDMRIQLIKASKAGDETYIHRITQKMRAYQNEDMETGLYQD